VPDVTLAHWRLPEIESGQGRTLIPTPRGKLDEIRAVGAKARADHFSGMK
jgi:hypothetical protein